MKDRSARLRILFATAWYPNRKVAGDGIFVRKHSQAVATRHDVAVLMVQSDAQIRGLHIEIESRRDADYPSLTEVCVYVPRIDREWPLLTGVLRLFWYLLGTLSGYRQICRQWHGRPEVSHVNVLTRACVLPWLLSRCCHIPYIITEHWSRYGRPAFPHGQFHLAVTRRFVRDAAYVCPVSANLEQNMLRWSLTNDHYERVGNVVDTALFVAAPFPEAACKRMIHVSWMRDESKNISGILRVLARLKESRQDFHLDLVGDGVDRERLMQLADTLGLQSYVSFVPPRQGASLVEALQAASFMLMFSHFENQPVSLLEAMACGRPAVASAVGDIPRMLDGRGITVPCGDEPALLRAINRMLDTYSDYQPALLHRYVEQHHSPEMIAQTFSDLYIRAIEKSF